MTKHILSSIVARLALAACLLAPIVAARAQPTSGDSRPVTQQMRIEQRQGEPLPLSTEWMDEQGSPVRLGDFFNQGRPVLVVPVFFTCQGSCALILEGTRFLIRNMKEMHPGKDYEVVVFSIHPGESSGNAQNKKTEMLNQLIERHNRQIDSRYIHFLTGSMDSITELTTALGYHYTWDPQTQRINHPAGIMLATADGKIAQYFYGWEFPQKLVITAINQAKMGQVGGPAEERLFGCLQYNPATGRYVLVAERALLVGGIATVIILALSIAVMSFKYRTRPEGPGPEQGLQE